MKRQKITATALVAGVLALSACGSSAASTGGNGGGTPTTGAPAATSRAGNGY